MKALQGVDGGVAWQQVPELSCDVGQIRVKVAAAGLNRADLLQVAGLYPPPAGVTQTLGLECAGVVVEVGAGSHWQVGDKVCCLLAGGAMAEEVVLDAHHAMPIPEGLSLLEAAAVPEVYATAWLNLFMLAGLKPGEKVLLHAGASGVGSAAIQLCKALGSPCWVSVGAQARLDYCLSLGAQGGALRSEDINALHALGPFDVILDPVGGSYAALNVDLLALDGRWVNIGLMGGRQAQLDLAKILGKRLHLMGSTLRNRDDRLKGDLLRELVQEVWPLFADGRLKAQVEQYFEADKAQQAFDALAGNQVAGKLVIVIDAKLAQ